MEVQTTPNGTAVQPATARVGATKDVYAIINNKLIEQLEKGTVPWRQPWKDVGLPQNLISKRYYHGINLMLLSFYGYEHNLYLTFDQLQKIGGKVKKGEHGNMVVYWNTVENKEKETEQTEKSQDKKQKRILRYYHVFNIAQCDKIPEKYLPVTRETMEIPTCESVVKGMPKCPPIKFKEQQAYYSPTKDFVNMPKKGGFKDDATYYSVLFHELVHSTGHESRLNRDTLMQMKELGGDAYSQEELVAEIGTCYLQSHTGITEVFDLSASYIQGWLTKLKGDKRFIFSAASAAQKAVDFILNNKDAKEDVVRGEE